MYENNYVSESLYQNFINECKNNEYIIERFGSIEDLSEKQIKILIEILFVYENDCDEESFFYDYGDLCYEIYYDSFGLIEEYGSDYYDEIIDYFEFMNRWFNMPPS